MDILSDIDKYDIENNWTPDRKRHTQYRIKIARKSKSLSLYRKRHLIRRLQAQIDYYDYINTIESGPN